MKHLAALFLVLAASAAYGQTVKSLGYNTTNGRVVYSGTNALTFTNSLAVATASGSSLSIGNTNSQIRRDPGSGSLVLTANANTNIFEFRSNGTLQISGPISFGLTTNAAGYAATTRTNLGLGLPALTNTNAASFRDAIGLGGWATLSDGGALRSEDLTISDGEQPDYIRFTAGSGVAFYGNRASQFRTALDLGLPALTNTSNATMMRALAGSTNTNHPFSGTVSVVGTNNTNTLVFSNGILQEVQ